MRACSTFQLHLTENRAGAPIINSSVSALRFFFTVTLDRADAARHLTFVHEPRKLPVVLSPEEVARLLEAAPGVKYKAALSVAYGADLAEPPGRIWSSSTLVIWAAPTHEAAKPRKRRCSLQSCGRCLLSRSSRVGVRG